jgi:myo-inositol-1(or 4)-monophosphatase
LSPKELEDIAVDISTEAAHLVRGGLGKARIVGTKSTPTDVVTAADLEVENVIRQALLLRTPGASIIGEEHGTVVGHTPIAWVIDPIDGTVNFLYDLPAIAVSIAAKVNGAVVAGAVVDVVRGEIFSAAAGEGARRNGHEIYASSVESLAEALVATGFAYTSDRRAEEAEVFSRVLPKARDIRCFGSAALHLCWVACGRVDAFYERGLKEWDMAAGALVATEAGALVEPASANNGDTVIVASPGIFDPLRRLVVA